MMTVKELKALLARFDDETEVVVALKYNAVQASPLVAVNLAKYVPQANAVAGGLFPKDDPGPFGLAVKEVVVIRGQW